MRILVLGSTGFVGRNISDHLGQFYTVIKTSSRKTDATDVIHFDLLDESSWENLPGTGVDLVINAAAYGVVKNQQELDKMYGINYFQLSRFYEFFLSKHPRVYWLQVGTAFEYDLTQAAITETSPCLPKTHYGISKLMMTEYLKAKAPAQQYSVLRPFGMFGPYEDASKFFPYLILAQKNNTEISLSAGTQKRDYFFVNDLSRFIHYLISNEKLAGLPAVLNLGSGKGESFLGYSAILGNALPSFSGKLWQWGKIPMRSNESDLFYNASSLAFEHGFELTDLQTAFKETVTYYYTAYVK